MHTNEKAESQSRASEGAQDTALVSGILLSAHSQKPTEHPQAEFQQGH
jgi:hypothetical protein